MEFLQLKDISERYLDFVNPTSAEKLLTVGRVAGLKPGDRLIDFGSGYGAVLMLWAEAFGVGGVGIDIRPAACERARHRLTERGLDGQIEIACGPAAEYPFEPGSFDAAACIGATFCWPGLFPDAVRAMKRAVKPGGRLIIGEVFWRDPDLVPAEVVQRESGIGSESKIFEQSREAGCEVMYALHSNQDEWDRYTAEDWRGLSDWLDENPDHADYDAVLKHLRDSQDEYAAYGRQHYGWGLYVLKVL